MNHHGSLNRVYRLIYSRVQNAWVAVSEVTKGQGKGKSRTRLMLILPVLLPVLAQASPTGGMVTSGTGKISQVGNTTTISQGSQSLNLSWTGFNIAPNETVNFNQPNASSVVVNRISDANGAQIEGHLNANGQVYLIDPNGILFGKGAQVNVGGLVAATMDFAGQGGVLSFSGNGGKAKIDNQGVLTAARGGFIALLGHVVRNEGTVTAQLGTVTLGGGSAFTLTFAGNDRVGVVVTRSQLNDLASNGGILQANGGNIVMTAGARDALLASSVNNSGIIEAQTVQGQAGHIQLLSGMGAGTTTNNGTLDASAPNGGNGGFIETSGHGVNMGNNATITTQATSGLNGSWLIDPVDFTIAASGGNETGATLSAALGTGNVTILSSSGSTGTAGNINVNDTVSWSANNILTLNAYNSININSALTSSGATGGVELLYGQGTATGVIGGTAAAYNVNAPVNLAVGNSFKTQLGSAGTLINYTVIDSLGVSGDATTAPVTPSLQGMAASSNLAGNFVLGSNIDATATSTWNANAGFTPIGSYATNFTGTFDGLGHTISNLTINTPSNNYVGLFGGTGSGSTVKNVGLVGGSVTGVSGVGGLVGANFGTISNAYATGSVTGGGYVGGLVGVNFGTISNAYATGSVSGTGNYVGGLVGYNNGGTISNAYATGSVTGGGYVGGLVGGNGGTISNAYATGSVSGTGNYVGGLVGVNFGTISNAYATGSVTGGGYVGGLVGGNGGTISNGYWDTTTSGQAGSSGGIGLTTTQMQTASSFAGFTFTSTPGATGNNWVMVDGNGTLNNTGGALGSTLPMLASEYSTTINNAHQLQLMAMNLGGAYTLGQNVNAVNTAVASATGFHDVWDTTGGFVPVGNSVTKFTGTFDGLGHTISNLTINTPSNSDVGLFGETGSGSTVKNVGLVGGSVTGVSGVGGLVGYNNGGTISNAYATGSVTGGGYVGGLVGGNGGTISNAYATGSVSGTGNYVGGLVGVNFGTISNAYATGSVSGTGNYVGGLVGVNFGTISNAYATGSVTGGGYVGGLVGGNGGTISNGYWDTTTSGQAGSSGGIGLTTTQMQTASSFAGFTFTSTPGATGNNWVMVDGNGTLNNTGGALGSTLPMLASEYSTTINNAHQLQLMAMNLGGAYTLGQNVNAVNTAVASATGFHDVWDTTGGFVPVGNSVTKFTGTFDGLGHTISNLTINTPSNSDVGLFGETGSGSTVKNVGLVGGSVTGVSGVGGLVGGNGGTISNAYATGSSVTGVDVGGLVGVNFGTISNAYATGSSVTGVDVGGLVGVNFGTISNAYATGSSVTGTGVDVGGLVGVNFGTISNAYATGRVTGGGYVGGLVGWNNIVGTISNGYWDSTVNGGVSGIRGGTLTGATVTGLTTTQMQIASNFTGFDFTVTPVWGFRTGVNNSNPILCSLSSCATLVAVAAASGSSVYGSAPGIVESLTNYGSGTLISLVNALTTGTASYGAAAGSSVPTASSNVGTYHLDYLSGLSLTGSGATNYYLVPSAKATNWQVTPLTLTGSIAAGNSVYGSTLTPGAVTFTNAVTGNVPAGIVGVTTTGHTSSSGNLNAGTYAGAETVTGLTGGTDTADYTFSGISGNYTVTPKPLTASIASASSTYGNTETPGAVSFANVVSSATGTKDVVSTTNTATVVSTAANQSTSGHLDAGTYNQTVAANGLTGTDANNYNFAGFTTTTANYTVNPLALTGAIASASSTYGNTETPGAVSFANVVSSATGTKDVVSTTNTATVVSTAANQSTSGHLDAGTYNQTVAANGLTGTDANNYNFAGFTTTTANYTVNPLALTGAIASASSTYGNTETPGAVSFANVVSSATGTKDVVSTTNGATVVSTAANQSTSGHLDAGTYNQTVAANGLTGTDANNYSFAGFTTATANYTVNPLALTGAIASASSTYGNTETPGAVSFANVVSSATGTKDVVSTTNGATVVSTAANQSTSGHLDAGTYNQTVAANGLTGTDANNYSFAGFTTTTANYTVNPLALTGAIASASSTYGNTETPGAVSFANVVSSATGTKDVVSTTNGATVVSTAANQSTSGHLDAGTYNQTVAANGLTGTDANNYNFAGFTTTTANYTVNPLALTGAIASASSTYGNTETPGAVSFANVVSSATGTKDVVSTTNTATVVSTAANQSTSGHLDAGTYNQTVAANGLTGVDAGNYSFAGFTTTTANYTVTPASLVYVAAAETLPTGQAQIPVSGIVKGFVSGDTLSTATTGTLSWTTDANASSAAGQYYVDGSGLSARNYVLSQDAGNATALTLQTASAPLSFQAAETNLLGTLNTMLSNANTVSQSSQPGGNAPLGNNYVVIGSSGMSASNINLKVINGGVNLPANLLAIGR